MPYKSVQFVESHVKFQPEKCLGEIKTKCNSILGGQISIYKLHYKTKY